MEDDFTATHVQGQLRIYSLAVGQGDCTVLICPENKDLFILDMGSVSSSHGNALDEDDVQDLLKAYAKKYTKARINIVVTHADNDHYNWLSRVFGDVTLKGRVDHFILGGARSDYDAGFITWADNVFDLSFINKQKECYGNAACTVDDNKYSTTDDFPQFCSRGKASKVKFEAMVANMVTSKYSKNAQSLVTVIDYNKFSMMLPGDFETKEAQDKLVKYYKNGNKLQVSMFKLSHHGASREANFNNFLQAVNPVQAFTSQAAPDTGTYHHPRCDAMNRLIAASSYIYDLKYPLQFDFPCYDDVAGTVSNPGWAKKDLHLTCPGDDDQPPSCPYCASMKIVSDGNHEAAIVYYIPV